MDKVYSEQQLNKAYMSLSEEQREVLDNYVKRGMKTKWLNLWAKKKGAVLKDYELEDPVKAMDSLLDWVLLDYEDSLTINPGTRCECGRALRYRYTVLHKPTGKTYKLGRVHFEQHTGLEHETVRLIMKGIKEIDTEREEILSKVIEKWTLPFVLPFDLQIPKSMTEQLKVKLPLLDRQENRLYLLIRQYYEGQNRNKITSKRMLPNFPKEPMNTYFEATCHLSNVDIKYLITRLESLQLTAGEARQLYSLIKHSPEKLEAEGIRLEDIKSMVTKALGKVGSSNIRKWLVEIEYM